MPNWVFLFQKWLFFYAFDYFFNSICSLFIRTLAVCWVSINISNSCRFLSNHFISSPFFIVFCVIFSNLLSMALWLSFLPYQLYFSWLLLWLSDIYWVFLLFFPLPFQVFFSSNFGISEFLFHRVPYCIQFPLECREDTFQRIYSIFWNHFSSVMYSLYVFLLTFFRRR